MKDRGDLLGDDLLPRKTKAQGSVPAPTIILNEAAPAPPAPAPEPAPVAPAPPAARPKEKGIAMTFRLVEADWIRLKNLTMKTRKSAQVLLQESLERLLKEHGL